MIVTIKAEIFNDSNNHSDLDDLMHFFRKGKHKMNLKKKEDFDAFDNSDWIKKLSISDIDLLKNSFSKIDKKEIIISETINETEFNLKEAYAYLQQPLSIVLENYEYEPDFINCIFKNFGNDLLEAKNKHWIKFENGGGKNDNTIKGMLKELFNDSIFTKNKETYLRCYSIKDSDRKYCIDPDKLPENTNTYLKDNNIPHHILYKRAKENYMPNSVLEKSDNEYLKTISKAFKDELKIDFFNITNGFDNKNKTDRDWKTTKKEEFDFFELESIDDSYFKILKKGVDKKDEFKRSFSKNFEYVTKEDLEKKINHQPKLTSKVNPKDSTERNEFEHIVHEIKYLL